MGSPAEKEPARALAAWPILALASHRLGQADAARSWLLKAGEFANRPGAGADRSPVLYPKDWPEFRRFLDEAEKLLQAR
jgi:hypothetical protein